MVLLPTGITDFRPADASVRSLHNDKWRCSTGSMSKYSYESTLSAVGRVLDEAGARSFAIREHDNGLLVEASATADTQPLAFNFDVADLVKLVERQGARDDSAP